MRIGLRHLAIGVLGIILTANACGDGIDIEMTCDNGIPQVNGIPHDCDVGGTCHDALGCESNGPDQDICPSPPTAPDGSFCASRACGQVSCGDQVITCTPCP